MGEEGEAGIEQVEEEFTVWKKNTPLLYDLIVSHSLEWPSLTVHWLPSPPLPVSTDGLFAVHKLILGTHTSDDFPNFLMVADAHLPLNPATAPATDPDHDSAIPKVEIIQKIYVDGEVNRARCMLQNPSLVAAKTSGSEVYVFDCSKHTMNEKGGPCEPDLRLMGHDKEGYGLSWSQFKEGYLLSGSNDCKICLWDVSAMPQDKVLNATHVYEVNYLSFNPYNEWVLATASSDTTVGLFDMRKLTSPLHVLSSHMEEVFQVEWDPNHETVLASSADDRRLMVWDLNRIGDEQLEGEAEDGPPELLFSHGGHKAKISDFSWNRNEPWVISSVAEDNSLQIWQMAESIYHDDDDDEGKTSSSR
ncbi:hypothetical protein ACSBR1_003647 [Camellia fascicularis]